MSGDPRDLILGSALVTDPRRTSPSGTALVVALARAGALGVLGFTPGQEELYRLLLRNSGNSAADLAALTALPPDELRERVSLLAQQYGQERSTWPVLPVLLHPVEKLPLSLGMLARLDATEEAEWDACVERLLRDLRREPGAAEQPPECPYPGMAPYDRDRSDAFHGRDAEIALSARRSVGRLHVTVDDDGAGLPPEFDADLSTTLGLSIVRTLVESELGGQFDIGPGPAGRGTRAAVDIPLLRD